MMSVGESRVCNSNPNVGGTEDRTGFRIGDNVDYSHEGTNSLKGSWRWLRMPRVSPVSPVSPMNMWLGRLERWVEIEVMRGCC